MNFFFSFEFISSRLFIFAFIHIHLMRDLSGLRRVLLVCATLRGHSDVHK